MNNRGTQNAQMQGPHSTPVIPEVGEFPWIIMAEGDRPLGFSRI